MSLKLSLPSDHAMALLHDVGRLFRKRYEQTARDRGLGVSRAQASVLVQLSRNQGINQVALAQLMELEPITLVGLLDRLQAAGLIQRCPDPTDRRARLLYLTAAAGPMIERINQFGVEIAHRSMAGMSDDERSQFLGFLETVKKNLARQVAAAEPQVETETEEQLING